MDPRNILANLLIEQVCLVANTLIEYVAENIAVEEEEEPEVEDVPETQGITYDELLALLFGAQYARPLTWGQ